MSTKRNIQKPSHPASHSRPQDSSRAQQNSRVQQSSRAQQTSCSQTTLRKQEFSVCPMAARCGACSRIEQPYASQLEFKNAAMAALYPNEAKAGLLRPIIGMDDPFYYRDKVISPFAPAKKGAKGKNPSSKDFSEKKSSGKNLSIKSSSGKSSKSKAAQSCEILTGMYAAGTHRLVNTARCKVENEAANRVIGAIAAIMKRHGMEPYDEDTQKGFVRHVIIRAGHTRPEMLVTIVTNASEFPSSKAFCRELVKACPTITTIVQNVNTRKTNVILGDEEHTLFGPGFILDELCGLTFRISSTSFYQINARQTEVLYNVAMDFAGLKDSDKAAAINTNSKSCADTFDIVPDSDGESCVDTFDTVSDFDGDSRADTVIDAYCGTGTIGLVAASRGAGRVIGIDVVESAVADARLNARHNGIENATFIAGDADHLMNYVPSDVDPTKTVLFMDPPRSGSTESFLRDVGSFGPERIVYISCNPNTQVRDIAVLSEYGYRVAIVQPVDMFPHTDHVETCVLLMREQ